MTISGTRKEGYVRIASTDKHSYQIRWKESKTAGDLEAKLETYLDRLRSDARKAKSKIDTHFTAEGQTLNYRYEGTSNGRGSIFYDEVTQRVFFIEVTSTRQDRLTQPFRSLSESFKTGEERWAVLGLNLLLPGQFKVERKSFLAGKTQLVLSRRFTSVDAQRWAFGQQLADKHGLSNWARSALELPRAAILEDAERVALEQRNVMGGVYALAKLQREHNQIVTVKVKTSKEQWRPSWDWLD